MEQSFQTHDNKRKHHAPAHAFFINQIFLLSNGPGNHFHGSFDTVILSFRNVETLSPKHNLKEQKFCERKLRKLKKILEISIFRVTSSK